MPRLSGRNLSEALFLFSLLWRVQGLRPMVNITRTILWEALWGLSYVGLDLGNEQDLTYGEVSRAFYLFYLG